VQLDQLVGVFHIGFTASSHSWAAANQCTPRGSGVSAFLEPPRQVLVALRMHRRDRGQVGKLGDRGAQDADVGRGSLVTRRAEGVPQPVLVELDAVRRDRVVDEPTLLVPPAGTRLVHHDRSRPRVMLVRDQGARRRAIVSNDRFCCQLS
jgi:hypothetical protein